MMTAHFEVETPLGYVVRTTQQHWERIVEHKHPVMKGKRDLVVTTLSSPEEIRKSRIDPHVYLYYRSEPETPYYICVVVKHLNGEGFIITCYRTDRIKEGERIWTP